MIKRKLTFATAQKVRQLSKEKGWGCVKISNELKKEGVIISSNAIDGILKGKTYTTRLQESGNSHVNKDIVRIIREKAAAGKRKEWISVWLELNHGIILSASAVWDIIARRTWKEVA